METRHEWYALWPHPAALSRSYHAEWQRKESQPLWQSDHAVELRTLCLVLFLSVIQWQTSLAHRTFASHGSYTSTWRHEAYHLLHLSPGLTYTPPRSGSERFSCLSLRPHFCNYIHICRRPRLHQPQESYYSRHYVKPLRPQKVTKERIWSDRAYTNRHSSSARTVDPERSSTFFLSILCAVLYPSPARSPG
ncbi:hypothetical protein HDK77DRAFT_100301 [Phyllosticta capitalensis]